MNYLKVSKKVLLDNNVQKFDCDRYHRVGKKYVYRGKTYQNVLLRLCSWSARDNIYKKRKELPFKVQADLTNRRAELLDYAKDLVENDPEAQGVVAFVFCDENCKVKIFSKSKKFFAFNSKYELCNIVYRLDQEANSPEGFLEDEKVGRSDLICPYDLFC